MRILFNVWAPCWIRLFFDFVGKKHNIGMLKWSNSIGGAGLSVVQNMREEIDSRLLFSNYPTIIVVISRLQTQ